MFVRACLHATAALVALAFAALPASAQESGDPIKMTLNDWTGQLISTKIMGEVLKKARLQRRIRPGRLSRPVRRPEDGRSRRRDGNLGDHRPGGDERGGGDRQGRESRRDRHAGQGRMVVSRIHEGKVPWPAELGGAEGSRSRPSRRRRLRRKVAILPARSPGAGSTKSASKRSICRSRSSTRAPTRRSSQSSKSAYQRQAPMMLWIYAPHWAPAKYKGEWVAFPEYEKACYEDPDGA